MSTEVPFGWGKVQLLGASLEQLESVDQAATDATIFEREQVESLKPVWVRKGPEWGDKLCGCALDLLQHSLIPLEDWKPDDRAVL